MFSRSLVLSLVAAVTGAFDTLIARNGTEHVTDRVCERIGRRASLAQSLGIATSTLDSDQVDASAVSRHAMGWSANL